MPGMKVSDVTFNKLRILNYFKIFFAISTLLCCARAQNPKPHIIFILADDTGYNDVSFHGSPQIPSPNIDALAASGIILKRYYAAPQCTPSRASLLTGKYASNTGLQHYVILAAQPDGLPLSMTLMPQHFKNLGYNTHMVGKWHLGYYKTEYTPTYRGFDSFYGYYNGLIDYYDFTYYSKSDIPGIQAFWGVDLHNNTEVVRGMQGNYSEDVFAQRAAEIIERHDASQPLFLYFSSHAAHAGPSYMPMQATPERVARFKYIKDHDRRTYAGILASLDDAVGTIFEALDSKNMLQNSIVVFVSDNGGEVNGTMGGQASNWPLRAEKFYTFEGGVRVPGIIWSPLLELKQPRTWEEKIHVSDWLPTLYSAAGGDVTDLGEIDGYDQWTALKNDSTSPRDEILVHIDQIYGMSGLIQGKYKLVNGTFPDDKIYWYGPTGREEVKPASLDEWVFKNGSTVRSIMVKNGYWLVKEPDTWRANATVNCGRRLRNICHPTRAPCLFDLETDPCEYRNIAALCPRKVKQMMARIREFKDKALAPLDDPQDPHGDPRCYGFAYVPWLDPDSVSACPYLD